MINWPLPKNVKELRGFLGLTGYYKRFVRNYGIIARALTDLTKKDAFLWTPKAKVAFQHLKQVLTITQVLCLPDFNQQFTVECDASTQGVGAILLQQGHPIAYFSKEFSFSNRIKSTCDCELLALVLALQKWKHYLLGQQSLVKTDHCSLKYLLNQRILTREQQRLLMKLLPFDFTILYKVGSENRGADALSRRPQHADFLALAMPIPMDFSTLREALDADPYTKQLISHLTASQPGFSLAANYLYYKSRLVVPDYPELKAKIVSEAHDSPTGGAGGARWIFKNS